MLPPLIVQEALANGIQIIAITDHNASANIIAVQKAAAGTDLVVLPGMELQTHEDIHVLCLFDSLDQIAELQKIVDAHLPPIANDPDHFGVQLIVDANGELLAQEERLLLTSVNLSITDVFKQVARLNGLFIPAHVNRKAYGLIEVLGFVPENIAVEALEISRHIKPVEVPTKFPQISGYPLIQNGDVHRLEEFLGVNHFHISVPTIEEIRLAIHTEDGRSMSILA
jgi:3',5'-nucleoside bisphosphate phosphatase